MIALPRLFPRLRSDELVGLVIAIAAHLALIVALAVHALRAPAIIPPPPRVTVSLAEDVGLVSEGQQVAQEAQAAVAPTLAENPEPAPLPAPLPEAKPKPEPKPSAKPSPKPVAKPVEKPKPKPVPPRATPAAQQRAVAPPKPQATKAGGGSRLGEDFLKGQGASEAEVLVPASQIGAAERADLRQAITRQLRPNWTAPNGLDAEKLRTEVTWRLNQDGTLAGSPTCEPTAGITESNRPQAARHCELAIRAIRKTRFNLPLKYYNIWKKLTWEFNKDLTQ